MKSATVHVFIDYYDAVLSAEFSERGEGKRLVSSVAVFVQCVTFKHYMMASSCPSVVEIESVSAGYRRHSSDNDNVVVCCLRVPNQLLQSWHADHMPTSPSYLELLNDAIRGGTITVDTNSQRLELQLQRRAGDVASKAAKTKPYRARQSFLAKYTTIDVYCGETVNAAQVMEELDVVSEDIEEWMKRCEGAEELIARLGTQIEACISQPTVNLGLPIDQVGERQRRRKMSTIRQSVHKSPLVCGEFWATGAVHHNEI